MLRSRVLALVLALPLAAQGPVQAQPQVPPQPRPEWVDALPQLPGRVYAVGMADLGSSEGQAISRAGERARLEVVSRLRATVKGQTVIDSKSFTSKATGDAKASGYGSQSFSETVAVSAQAEDLPGLSIERTYLDPKGRAAYALAALDLGQAARGLSERLKTLTTTRVRAEKEATRKVLWRLRKAQSDLDQLDAQAAMLAPAGLDPGLRAALAEEREKLDARLSKLEAMSLPALDMAKMTVSIRSNIDLPPNLSDWLDAQITAAGLRRRSAGADFVLDLTFQGGSRGPEFIFAEPQFWGSLTYRIEAKAAMKDSTGVVLGKVSPISLAKDDSAQGLMEEFERLFRRRFNALVDQLRSELE